ncbi:hypothetical protein CDAR_60291 [Caerostris darwini]|uniref:Uncharacterized protein n=1 Tax=Caerostris darwini TaxID=1538125 RepID=A0AAV4QKH0_9ARAC|nr:hypothetical protein CDAR_60291 [Caerostris darwini]
MASLDSSEHKNDPQTAATARDGVRWNPHRKTFTMAVMAVGGAVAYSLKKHDVEYVCSVTPRDRKDICQEKRSLTDSNKER